MHRAAPSCTERQAFVVHVWCTGVVGGHDDLDRLDITIIPDSEDPDGAFGGFRVATSKPGNFLVKGPILMWHPTGARWARR